MSRGRVEQTCTDISFRSVSHQCKNRAWLIPVPLCSPSFFHSVHWTTKYSNENPTDIWIVNHNLWWSLDFNDAYHFSDFIISVERKLLYHSSSSTKTLINVEFLKYKNKDIEMLLWKRKVLVMLWWKCKEQVVITGRISN